MRRSLLLCAASFILSVSAVAQTKVCMGGNFEGMTGAERHACENQVSMAREAAAAAKAPADWHFVVVCGEDGWKDYMAFSQQSAARLSGASSDTDFANRTTFLRGTRLDSAVAAVQTVGNSLRKPMADGIQLASN